MLFSNIVKDSNFAMGEDMTAATKKPRSAKKPTAPAAETEPDPQQLSLNDVAKQFGGVHVSTVWRWGHEGVCGVKLRLFRIAGRRYATQADVDEFKAALEALDDPEPETRPPSVANARAAKKNKHAGRELDAVGI